MSSDPVSAGAPGRRRHLAPISRRGLIVAGAAFGAGTSMTAAQDRAGLETVEISAAETATIDGRSWDKPLVGGTTVDAVHRSVLLRFPAMAETITAALRKGNAIVRADLAITYDGYELIPTGYAYREVARKAWTEDPPTWHVQAWPLRKPWFADPALGPTFNASVNGRRFWSLYGAADPASDRYVDLLAPQELSVSAVKRASTSLVCC
jgi:hypothetical protein